MATTVNIHEAKTHLSKLLKQALAGEEITIASAGKPLVRLTPVADSQPKPSLLGGLAHMNWKVPDDFDNYMKDEIEAMFSGEADRELRERTNRPDPLHEYFPPPWKGKKKAR